MSHECKYEERVLEMANDITETKGDVKLLSARINGSMDTFFDHVKQGKGWRVAVSSSLVILIMNILVFAYMFGIINKTVNVNERIIQRILNKYEHIDTEEI